LLRLRLFGWNVLFTHGLLDRPDHPSGSRARTRRRRIAGVGTGLAIRSRQPTLSRRTGRDAAGTAHEQLASLRPRRRDPQSTPRNGRRRRSHRAASCFAHAPSRPLAALSTALIRSAPPSDRVTAARQLPPEIRRDGSRLTRLPASASAHVWTHLWTTLGSRYRGDTCRR
jgi:hypothetical protein